MFHHSFINRGDYSIFGVLYELCSFTQWDVDSSLKLQRELQIFHPFSHKSCEMFLERTWEIISQFQLLFFGLLGKNSDAQSFHNSVSVSLAQLSLGVLNIHFNADYVLIR